MELDFEILKKGEAYPYHLLLLADETVDAIHRYLLDSIVYLVKNKNQEIGVFCLYQLDENTIELKNIAVAEAFQSKGLGSLIIDYIKGACGENYKILVVGTADSGHRQIQFYKNNGFVEFDIKKNFFIDNYEEPIFENGVQLKDMLMLKYEL